MNYQEFMPEPLRASVRDRLGEVLAEIARSGKAPPRQADDALLREMMAVATGEVVPDEWSQKGMTNWYRNRHGRVFAITPRRLVEYWKVTSAFRPEEYEIR